MRQFPPSEYLLLEKNVEEAVQLVEGLFGPKSQAQKRLSELVWDHQLLLLGLCLGICLTKAQNQVLSARLATANLHL